MLCIFSGGCWPAGPAPSGSGGRDVSTPSGDWAVGQTLYP